MSDGTSERQVHKLWLALSLAIIILGVIASTNQTTILDIAIGPIILTFGGAFLGSTFSNIASYKERKGFQETMNNQLALLTKPKIESLEEKVSPYRKKWHYYYVTCMRNEYFWRHLVLDFQDRKVTGRLNTATKLKNLKNEYERYEVDCGIRQARMILTVTPLDDEEEPTMTATFWSLGKRAEYFGTKYIMTWDHDHELSPCIISDTPLTKSHVTEQRMSEEDCERLDEKWKSEFTKNNNVLPRIVGNKNL